MTGRLGFPVPAAVAERLPVHVSTYRAHDDVLPPATGAARRALLATGAVTAFGLLLLSVTVGYLSASAWPAITIAILVGLGAAGMVAKREVDRRRAEAPEPPPVSA